MFRKKKIVISNGINEDVTKYLVKVGTLMYIDEKELRKIRRKSFISAFAVISLSAVGSYLFIKNVNK